MTLVLMKYLELNLLCAVAAVFSSAALWLYLRFRLLSAASLLRLQYALLAAVLVLPLLSLTFPSPGYQPAAQIWAAPSMQSLAATPRDLPKQAQVVTFETSQPQPKGQPLSWWLLTPILLAAAGRHLRDRRNLSRLLRDTVPIRRHGKVGILAAHQELSPFSCRHRGRFLVVLPLSVLDQPQTCRIVLAHELQHHRQGDTTAAPWLDLLTKICIWNPLIHMWMRQIQDIREYACDEALIGRNVASPRAYGRCLLEVASHTLEAHRRPIGAMGLTTSASAKRLQRRIDMIFKGKPNGGAVAVTCLIGAILLLSASSFAANGLIRDRRISMRDAQTWAKTAAKESAMPIVANERVLYQLNRFLGTPDGRAFLRNSLANLKSHEPLINEKLQEYRMPAELAAVAILESGVNELGVNRNPPHAAGMWQFIPGTARNFNLRVDDEVDERLDPDLATDAAMRLLGSLHLRFQDWGLALMAYNAGAGRIQKGINDTGKRDAWSLIEAGYEGDSEYLSRLVAIMIVLKHPHLLD